MLDPESKYARKNYCILIQYKYEFSDKPISSHEIKIISDCISFHQCFSNNFFYSCQALCDSDLTFNVNLQN